jgi:signal transduction histidine kinase
MTVSAGPGFIDELVFGSSLKLEELIDRKALAELLESVRELFEVPVRVYSEDGRLLADAASENQLYGYLSEFRGLRTRIEETVLNVKQLVPGADGVARHTCVTGASYCVTRIEYDGHSMGRFILGPYAPAGATPALDALATLEENLDRARTTDLFQRLPRVSEETAARIGHHLSRLLDLVLFSEHRALLTSQMHLASVRESFRELEDKSKKLEAAYAKLTELDRLKSNFLATMSHELRTPLTSIIGYSEMLVEGLAGDLSSEQRDFVQTIREKGEQLLVLIKGLLDLSKLESGTMSLRKDHVEAAKVVRDVMSTVQPHALRKDVRLIQSVDPGLPRVWVDGDRLGQVLLNLSENAVKFTPAGGCVSIEAKLTRMDPEPLGAAQHGMVLLGTKRTAVEFRVADTGIGIPEPERARVFDAFYQVDSSSTREQGGTGLGLSIVKRLVEAHDGTVSIESNSPSGTVFVVRLPLRHTSLG